MEVCHANLAAVDTTSTALAYMGGRTVQARPLLVDAWERLGRGRTPGPRAASIAAQLCSLGIVAQEMDAMVAWGEAARAAESDAALGQGLVAGMRTVALAVVGRAPEALQQMRPLGAAGGVPGAQLDGVVARGMVRLWTDDLDRARADLSVALARARAGEPVRLIGQAAGHLGEACYRAGAARRRWRLSGVG